MTADSGFRVLTTSLHRARRQGLSRRPERRAARFLEGRDGRFTFYKQHLAPLFVARQARLRHRAIRPHVQDAHDKQLSLVAKGDQKIENQGETRAVELDMAYKLAKNDVQHRRRERPAVKTIRRMFP